MDFTIRPAVFDDAPAIATAHVRTWQTTYSKVLPPEFLNGLSIERREEMWRGILSNPPERNYLYVAEADGAVIGFASFGVKRDDYPGYDCELYAIYLLQTYQRKGVGRALFKSVTAKLIADGYSKMFVWVLERNDAIKFYEAMGGVRFDERPIDIAGTVLSEYAYGYTELKSL